MTDKAWGFLESLGTIGFWILIFFIACAIFAGFFNDKINAVFCILIGVVVCILLNKLCYSNSSIDTKSLVIAIVTAVWFIIRYLPCVSINQENSTYLISGTLVNVTDTYIVGFLIPIIMAILSGLGSYFLANWALTQGYEFIGIAIGVFLIIYSTIGFIKSLIC